VRCARRVIAEGAIRTSRFHKRNPPGLAARAADLIGGKAPPHPIFRVSRRAARRIEGKFSLISPSLFMENL